MKPTLEEFKSFSGHMDFMKDCEIKHIPYSKFRLFQYVKKINDKHIGRVIGLSWGQSTAIESEKRIQSGWFYRIELDGAEPLEDIPENELTKPFEQNEQ